MSALHDHERKVINALVALVISMLIAEVATIMILVCRHG